MMQPNTPNAAASTMAEMHKDIGPAGEPGSAKQADNDDAALISQFASRVEVPQWLREKFLQMVTDRDYVRRDCMLQDTQDTVATNHILRAQTLTLAYMGVFDPQPFCQPARRVGKQVAYPVELFSETMEIHLANQARQMRFAETLAGTCQDGSTNSYAIVKCTLQSDYMKDPVGEARFGDQQEAVAEYARLKELVDTKEIIEGTSEYALFKDMENTLRIFAAGKVEEQIKTVPQMVPGMVPALNPATGQPLLDPITLQPQLVPGMVSDPQDPRELQRISILEGKELDILGLPCVPHYMGFKCDQILPEDFRWDWRITRPEDINKAEWMAHRVFMRPDEIARKWGVDMKELQAGMHTQTATGRMSTARDTSLEPTQRMNPEVQSVNEELAVWEVYYKPNMHRYVFLPGLNKFLEKEVFQACGSRFFPFFVLAFNRVTGQFAPPSDVQLVRKLHDEINTLRSHDREARRSSYPVLFVQKGLMDPATQEMYRNRYPFSVIECERSQELKAAMSESNVIPYNPQLYDTSKCEGDLQEMFGLPRVVTGGPDSNDLASSLALAKEGMETGVSSRRITVNRLITDVFQWMAEISLKVFPESYIKKTCGDAAIWPRMTIDELYTNIRIEVKGGMTGQPRAKDRLDLWQNFATICQTLAIPVNGPEVLRELLDGLGLRVDFTRFIMPVAMPGMAPGPGAPMPQAPAAPGAGSKGQGPDGGAPEMGTPNRPAPSSLAQIPNHPPLPKEPPA